MKKKARIAIDSTLRDALMDPERVPHTITVDGQEYRLDHPVAFGFKGVVWHATDPHSRERALKLKVSDDYKDKPVLLEVDLLARLEKFPIFAKLWGAGRVTIPVEGYGDQEFICFVEDWIDGLTLEEFLAAHGDDVNASFLTSYVEAMTEALSALNTNSLTHDDLHAGNTMLERPPDGSLNDSWIVRVIDPGSLKRAPSSKSEGDHENFVRHLVKIWNSIHSRRSGLPAREARFLKASERLISSMLDEDPTVALKDPARIRELFKAEESRSRWQTPDRQSLLVSPFEFISAEHIADDRLLVDLFAKSCPWLSKVSGPDPCMVTGPRGCGKSTIFRWLSLRAHLHKPIEELPEMGISGFYISCSSDLQNKLGWIRTEKTAKKFAREIVHYFNMIATREVLETAQIMSERPDLASNWGLGSAEERAIRDFVLDSLDPGIQPRLQGVSPIQQAIEAIEREMFQTNQSMTRAVNIARPTGESYLGQLTALMARLLPGFAGKPIAFLVDDFSDHRLPRPVQRVLNRVIWERRASHVFKLSAEKYGSSLNDWRGAPIDATREMIEVDCGKEYVELQDSEQHSRALEFATELLNRRLQIAGFAGDGEMLLGPSEWEEGSLGSALVKAHEGRDRYPDEYHGLDCIADLCSGDVSTLLLVYRRIFETAGVDKETTTRIKKRIQDQAIVDVSRELMDSVRAYFPLGPDMHRVAHAFGNLVRRILNEGRLVKAGSIQRPAQVPRIEIDQTRGGTLEQLDQKRRALAVEMIKRAVFIEMEPGLSRHKAVTTLRWNLRRVYLPVFRAALTKNDAVKRGFEWFDYLLQNPEDACEREWKAWRRRGSIAEQPELELK